LLEVRDVNGYTALNYAAANGHMSIVQLLVQHGADINAVNNRSRTPLFVASMHQHVDVVSCLLTAGADVSTVDFQGYTALHTACAEHSGDTAAVVELLLANGADVHKCNTRQQTALAVAAFNGKLQCAKALIAAGADVNHIDTYGYYTLHVAIRGQQAALVQLLLDNGATAVMNSVILLNTLENYQHGMTALMMCTTTDTVKLLLAAGADVHVRNEVGDTCLHTAAGYRTLAAKLCLLIKAGADLQAVNDKGETAAQIAHDVGNTLIEEILIRAAQQGH
jgi:uncharacterized protein